MDLLMISFGKKLGQNATLREWFTRAARNCLSEMPWRFSGEGPLENTGAHPRPHGPFCFLLAAEPLPSARFQLVLGVAQKIRGK